MAKFDHLTPYAQVYVVRGSGARRSERNCERAMIMPPGPLQDPEGRWICKIQTIQDREGSTNHYAQGHVRTVPANRLRLSTNSYLQS